MSSKYEGLCMKPNIDRSIYLKIINNARIDYYLTHSIERDRKTRSMITVIRIFDVEKDESILIKDRFAQGISLVNRIEVIENKKTKVVSKQGFIKIINRTNDTITFMNTGKYEGYDYTNNIMEFILERMINTYKAYFENVTTISPRRSKVISITSHASSVPVDKIIHVMYEGNPGPHIKDMW